MEKKGAARRHRHSTRHQHQHPRSGFHWPARTPTGRALYTLDEDTRPAARFIFVYFSTALRVTSSVRTRSPYEVEKLSGLFGDARQRGLRAPGSISPARGGRRNVCFHPQRMRNATPPQRVGGRSWIALLWPPPLRGSLPRDLHFAASSLHTVVDADTSITTSSVLKIPKPSNTTNHRHAGQFHGCQT